MAQAPLKANVVVFETDSIVDAELFRIVVFSMKESGFQLKNLDKDFLICSTEPIKDQNYECKLSISVIGKKLEIRSYYRMTTDMSFITGSSKSIDKNNDDSWDRAANKGLKTSIYRFAFEKAERLAQKVFSKTDGTITYKTEDI